jgi:hypothetical protein
VKLRRFQMNLSKNVKVTPVLAYASAGTGSDNGTILDMEGFEGVMFVGGGFATADAGNYYKLQQDTDSAGGTMADLEGSKIVPGDNDDDICLDLYKPQERYVRIVRVRGASSAADPVYAIQYGGVRKRPTSHSSTVDSELHISPDEGTA